MTQDVLMKEDKLPLTTSDSGRNQLKQFCLLAKTAHGAAILELIKQVLEAPGIYVFGELLAMPNVQELKFGADVKYFNTLNLFAYGTYKQYRQEAENYLNLTPVMQNKLKHLTIVSLAVKSKSISYEVLMQELEIDNIRHLEDLIIESIYADIIHGKLFQNNRILEVDYAQGRDIPPNYTTVIAKTLQEWVDSCDAITNCINSQIGRANAEKSLYNENKKKIEEKLNSMKQIYKTQISSGVDADVDSMQIDTRESPITSQEVRKKSNKTPRSAGEP